MSETNGKIISGRRNWDVVAFDDYQKDTSEIAKRAGSIIAQQRRELSRAEAIVAALVHAAGGRIEISELALHRLDGPSLTKAYDEQRMQWIFTTQEPL